MAIIPEIKYSDVDNLLLDPLNPRMGRRNLDRGRPQEELLNEMMSYNLEELAHSFIEAKAFWPQEAVMVVEEELYGDKRLVVVEGNRRIATLKWLKRCASGNPPRRSWIRLFATTGLPTTLFEKVPYFVATERDDLDEFLGFRHVTGIKPWSAADKAYFMSQLLERGQSYDDVRRAVGSTNPAVKANYLSYRVLLQMESIEDFDPDRARNRFAPLYMALKTASAREYLGIPTEIEPDQDCMPVPKERLPQLQHFARWLFGGGGADPLITDTRNVANFGRALQDPEARKYLERDPNPKLDSAMRMVGDELCETIENATLAGDYAGIALSTAHLYRESDELQKAIERLRKTVEGLVAAVRQED